MQIPAIQFDQEGKKLYSTVLPISFFAKENLVQVDVFDAKKKPEGYQRIPTSSRSRDFARYIRNSHGISPTAILLNVRTTTGDFKSINHEYGFGMLKLPENEPLWIVDGQHRISGFQELLESTQEESSFGYYQVPVVVMFEPEPYEEAKQFIIINTTQKGVKPDLAIQFIAKMSRREGSKALLNLPRQTTREIKWRPDAKEIVDILNTRNSEDPKNDFHNNPWEGNIQIANEKIRKIINEKALQDSLAPVVKNPLFQGSSREEQAIVLVRYWKALRELCPWAFEDPDSYVMQRTMGVSVLHNIFPRVVTIASSGGKERLTVNRFKEVLSKMNEKLNEDSSAQVNVFWSNEGDAGVLGTSRKAMDILSTKLRDWLEQGNGEDGTPNRQFAL